MPSTLFDDDDKLPYAGLLRDDPARAPSHVPPSYRAEYERLARRVMGEHPSWDAGQVRQEVEKRLEAQQFNAGK